MIKVFKDIQEATVFFKLGNYSIEFEDLTELPFLNSLQSSYIQSNFGSLFYSFVRKLKPRLFIELGVLSGYSLFSSALGLQKNMHGKIIGIDLFEDYQYKNDTFLNVTSRINELKLNNICTLLQGSAFDPKLAAYKPNFLHVDLSNHGETIEKIFESWASVVQECIFFEGGSPQRDNVQWMDEYGKLPMDPVFKKFSRDSRFKDWEFYRVNSFPSMSICLRSKPGS
jgi:hypothetical protein